MRKRPFLLGLAVMAAVIALDQWSKALALGHLTGRSVEVTSFFNLALVWNYGISFGLFAGHRQPLLLTALSAAIVAVLFVWLHGNRSPLLGAALGGVIGGALGNMIDRLRHGAVVDFLDVHIGGYHWPAFNVADSAIFIGVVLLCIDGMVTADRHQR